MKITKFKRALSVLLVAVMIISTLPLNAMGLDEMERSTRPADSSNGILDDLWEIFIKPFIKPKVTVKGLPENAEGGIEIVTDPFSSKAKSSLGTFLDFYDIKAKDKTTGEIVHPEGEVEVTIKDARIKQNQSVFLIHVLDDENVIKNADNVTLITEAAFVSAFKNAAKAAENALGVSGAVAVEYINDLQISGRDITFKTSSFSIYVVTEDPRLKVNFYNGDKNESNLIVSILVTKSNTLSSSYETVLYDPGVELENSTDRIFRGWIGADPGNAYTAEDADNALTIADVRDLVAQKLAGNITDLEEIDFFAMMFRRFMVTYLDKAGVVALGRDFVLTRESDNATVNGVDYQINMNYVPDTQDEDFKGWYPISDESGYPDNIAHIMGNYDPEYQEDEKPDSTVSYTEGYSNQIYVNPSWIKIKGDLYLKAYSPSGYWLSFEENGKGASYTPPQFIESAESVPTVTVRPTDPTRLGWDFVNWYEPEYETVIIDGNEVTQPKKDDNGNVILSSTPFTFGTKLTKRTTVYAKWTPHTTANYTVIVWKERMTDTYAQNGGTGEGKEKNYDFAESFTLNGNTGDIISTVVRSTNSYVTDGDQDGTRYDNAVVDGTTISGKRVKADYTGFHCASIDENVVIVPEGTSVVNVYYDRNTVTYTFYTYTDNGGYVVATDETEPQWGIVNGDYKELRKESRDVTVWTPAYTYARANNDNGTQYALIDGEYVELRRESEQTTTYRWRERDYSTNYWFDEVSYDGVFYVRTGGSGSWTNPYTYGASGYTLDNPPPINNGVTYYCRESAYSTTYYALEPIATTTTTYTWYNGDEVYDGNRYTRTTGGSEYSGKRYLLEDGTYTETTGEDGTQYMVDPYGGHVQLNKGTEARTVWVIPVLEPNYEIDNTNGEYALVGEEYVKLDPIYEYTYTPTGYTYTRSTNDNDNNPTKYGIVNGNIQQIYYRNNNFRLTDERNGTVYNGYRYTRAVTTDTNPYTGTLYTTISNTAGTNQSGFTTGGSENLYGKGNGDVYFQLETTATVVGYTLNGETYTGDRYTVTYEETGETEIYYGPRYKKTTGTGWHIYQANVGLYGETLPWPEDSSIWWYESYNGTQGSGTRMTYKSAFLPLDADMTVEYWGKRNNTGDNRIIFYTQDLDNTNSYTAQYSVYTEANRFNINDKFTGFYAAQYRSNNGTWNNVGTLNPNTGIYGDTVSFTNVLEIRYNRITGTITFMDGKYFNGNGVGTDEVPKGDPFKTSDTYYYEADVSTYNKEGADYYTPPVYHEGYVFAGWYADDACTHEYDFTTMPAGGITVYAKWVQKQYRVFLHPGVPTSDTSLEWGDNTQPMTFRVDYGTKISGGQMIVGERDLYEIVGWYYDPDFKKPFNFDAYVLNDNTVRDDYDKDAVDTDYMGRHGVIGWWDETDIQNYPDDLTGVELGSHTNKDKTKNRFWINKQLNLYAKWKHKIVGADGVYLVYDAGEGTFIGGGTTYSDGILYDDAAHTYGIAASVAPEGKFFRYWSVQKWEDGQYKDTGDVVYPGELFHIDYTLAKPVSVTDELHPEHKFDYFMRLVAVYTEAEAPVVDVKYDRNATDAVWSIGSEVEAYKDNNNESVYYKKYTDDQYGFAIEINKEFSILKNEDYLTRTGYKFLGWAFDKNMSAETFKSTLATETAQGYSGNRTVFAGGEGGVAADDLDTPNSSINTLYAIWEINRYDVDVVKVLENKGVTDTYDDDYKFTFDYDIEYPAGYTAISTDAKDTTGAKVSVNEKYTIENIPHGSKLTVTERLTTAEGKVFTVTYTNNVIASVTAEKDGDLAETVTITNTRKDVDLYIRKFVDLDKDAGKTFRFDVTINGVTSSVNATSAKTGTEATGTKITVPYGSTVTVSEVTTDTYETYNGTSYSVADIFDTTGAADWTVTATEEQTHDFTNKRKTVKIYVTKDVMDSLDPADRDYLFKFTINGEERSAKAGETTDYVEVPIGTEVTVVETDKNGNYITEWAISGSGETKIESDTANIGQRYGDTTVIFTNTREKVPLTITKTVDKEVDNGKEFYFDVTINDTTEKKTVKGGESITINVMYGAPVSVTERISDEYNRTGYTVAQLFKTDAAKSADHLTTATEWTFNNVRRVGKLTVTKEVVSDYAPDYTNKTYNFTYTVNGGTPVPFSITINGDKTNTYTTPVEFFVGDVVVVTEVDLQDAYMTQSAAVTVTIAEGNGNTAKITNTRKDVTVTVIKKLAEEDSFNNDKNFTFKVGEVEKTATVGGANAVFTLTYGTAFTLEEVELNAKYMDPTFESAGDLTGSNGSYTAMGDGTITVTNKVKRIPVVVKKTVNGDAEDKAANYNFNVLSSIGSVTSDAEGKTAITTLVIEGGKETTVYVPYGAALTATETIGGVNGREYKTTINGAETKTHTTGTLTAEGTTIEFVNTRIVTVTVVKAVSKADETLVGTDTFEVKVAGDNVAENDKKFNISLAQNKTFKVPYNSMFTVTESLGDLAWKYQTPEYSGGSNTYTATADTTVTITNKLQTYKVKVIKSVSDPNYYANGTKFYFDQTGLPTDNPFTLGLGRDGEDPKSVEFTVKAGTVVTVKERPGDETKSTTFTLTTGVTSTSSEYPSFTVKKDTEVEFTNVINVYPVTVKKEIDNSALDSDFSELTDNFKLEYEVYDANGVKITEVKGNDAVDLKPGEDTVILNVPYGGHVKVNEISDDRYTTTYKSGDKTNGTCAEVKNDQTVITVTNTRKATSLTIEKIVDSTVEADKETREYVFTVMIGTVEKTVKIRGKGTGTLPNLPVGESVTVTEAEQANMDTTSEHVSYTLAENADSNKSTFTNKRRVVTITVEKTVVSRVKADYTTYTFSYEYTVDNVDNHKYEGTATIEIAEPNNSGTTTISVPEGATAFKLTEDPVDKNLRVTYSNNEIAGPITTSPATVTVTNERPEIPVTIEKVVVSDINDYSNYDFKFDYTVKFGNQTVESGTKSITGAGTNNEITVPKGADITVTEQTGVKYTTINNADFTVAQVFDTTYSSDTLTGVVAEGGKITVTNTRKLVEVTVKKVVDNKWNIASDLTKEFSFKFDSAKMYTGTDYATVITNADTTKLAHNGEIKIKVPFGATFTATETEDPAFDTKVRINSDADAEALTATTDPLTADGTVITFTNTRKPIKVEVQKHVNKFFDEDIDEKFYFEAAVMFGGSAWALPTADRAFDLMDYLTDNTRKHVFEVPYGSNIQVKEVNHTGFTSSATLNGEDYDQNMTATPLTQDATVIIKNDRDRVTITVTKTVATDAKLKTVDEAINFPFTYSWTKNENFKRDATSFPLKHGQEYTFTVPVGAAVNVNELTDTELTVYNNLKISDVFATVSEYGTTTDDQTVSFNADAATTVAFTNTHKTVKVNLVKAVNLEQDKNVNFEFTWSAVYGTGENAIDFTTDNGTATRNHNTTATLLCTVPVGVKISVTEILPSEQGFVTPNIAYTTGAVGTVDGAVVTISDIKADATITYTNSRQVFDITFGKKVVNGVANDNEFPFRFTYTDNGGEEHEVFISDNGSITIPKVPYGHTIVITEDVLNQLSAYGNFKVADIFATAISGQSGNCTVDGAKVTITVKKDENITFTNTHKTSTVTITKTVESKNESDKQHEFPFNATAHAGNTYVIGSADEKDSFSLKHTGTKVYTVPYGFEFTVGEEPDTRYNTSIKFDGTSEAAQVKSFTAAKDAYTIAYLNERAQGDLKIVKTGVGETTDAFLFKVTKNNDTTFKPLFVTIHGNGSVYVMQLEAGDYKVEEVTDWSWRYDKQTEEITNEADGADKTDNMATIMGGETGDEAPTVTFTNKKNNKNWLGTECGGDNKYDPQLTAAVDPAAEQVAWDSKIRLAYASPADKFRDNKETA